MTIPNSLKTQVGGSHYKKYRHQPLEFAEKHGLSPIIFVSSSMFVDTKISKNLLKICKKPYIALTSLLNVGKRKVFCIT